MKVYLIAVCVLFSLGTFGMLFSNLFLLVVIGELNKKRQKSNQLSMFYLATPWRIATILKEYRLRYPEGRFLRYFWACLIVGFTCFLASVGVFVYASQLMQSRMN